MINRVIRIKDLNTNKKVAILLIVLLAISITVAFLSFVRDLNNTIYYGGVDLRSNVIGARLLIDNKDPYYYIWKEGDSELFLHPTVNNSIPVGHVTISPTTILLFIPTARLPYGIQQNIWFILQWGFLIASIYIFARESRSEVKSKLIWIFGLLFISGSFFWRLNIERSKIIIIYGFLITIAFLLLNKSFKHKELISGIIIGFTAALRFPYLLFGVPLLIYKKWKILLGMFLGFLIGVTLPLIFIKPTIWVNYFNAMQMYGKLHTGEIKWEEFGYIIRNIEGMGNLHLYAIMPILDSSIQGLFINYTGIILNTQVLLPALLVVLSIIIIFLYKYRFKNMSNALFFLICMGLVYICELFIPAVRWNYYDVIFLNILLLMVINMDFISDLVNPFLIFLVFWFLSNILYLKVFNYSLLIGSVSILIYVVSMTVLIYKKEKIKDSQLNYLENQ